MRRKEGIRRGEKSGVQIFFPPDEGKRAEWPEKRKPTKVNLREAEVFESAEMRKKEELNDKRGRFSNINGGERD